MFTTLPSKTTPFSFCFNHEDIDIIFDGSEEFVLDKSTNQKIPIEKFIKKPDKNYIVFIIKKKKL